MPFFPAARTDQQQNRRTIAGLWKRSASGFNKRPAQTADALPCQLLLGAAKLLIWTAFQKKKKKKERGKKRRAHTEEGGCVVIIMTSAESLIRELWFCNGSPGW